MTRVTRVTSLVGRDREVQLLRDTIAAAAGGRGQVVLIEGEPGIGKTRLVHRGAELGRTAGFEVSLGTCDDLLAARPFAALITALGIRLDASDAVRAAIASLVDSHDASDAALLRGAPNPGLQYRVVEALGALVERQAARGPLLLALDDLQWADASTLVALRSIGRRIDTLPVVVIGSCRVGHGVAELHRVTDDLLRAGATRLFVGPLDPASVATLISEVIDGTPSDLLLERAQGASGNPLFVIEYVRSTRPTRGGGNGESDSPQEFRLTVLRRLAALSAKTNEAVRLAAVLGSTFSPADLAVASRRPIVDLAPALHEAVVSAMLEERGTHLAWHDDVNGNQDQGSAYMFSRTGTNWIEQAHLIVGDGAAGDEFGRSAAVSGDTVVLGAQRDTTGANAQQGSAYVFTRHGSTWPEQTKLLASDGGTADLFGVSVAISRDTAVIGAGFHNLHRGAAYVWEDPTACVRRCGSRSTLSQTTTSPATTSVLPAVK